MKQLDRLFRAGTTRSLMCIVVWLLAFCITPTASEAQPWSGILSPSRAVDWTNVGIPGGIPNRTTLCATLNPGATAAQINNAISACPAGQVVFLNAGTYNLAGEIIMKSNVTLRGAGADQTILKFSGGGNACSLGGNEDVCFAGSFNWTGGPSNLTTWTSGYAKGTTQITLGSTAGLQPGRLLILDQANDLIDTGQMFVCDTVGVCASDTTAPGRTVGGVNYNQQEYKLVTAINGNVVTISPGLYMPNWRASQNPSAWWANTIIQNAGIENMTLDHSASNRITGIAFDNSYQCWAKNIRSIDFPGAAGPGRSHIWLLNSARTEIRDSYFYGARNGQGNWSQSYGIEPWMSSDVRVENNIFQHVASPILIGCCSGSVFGYNYCIDNFNGAGNTFQFPCLSSHDAAGDMILVEGNQSSSHILQDSIHGTHNFQTVFRNQMGGREATKTSETVPANFYSHARYINLLGNVFGTGNYHNNYAIVSGGSTTSCATSIYLFGFGGTGCRTASVPADSLVALTSMRWGNYDVVNDAVRFVNADVPSGISLFANPVPASQTLPPSFYLTARPSAWWGTPWGTPPWPPVGPDVTGGTVTSGTSTLGGHAHKIPARLCYENTPIDGTYGSNNVLLFNASQCYVSQPQSTPSSPSAVTTQ